MSVCSEVIHFSAGSTTRTDVEYRANRDSSPKYAEPQAVITAGRSSLYTYDDLHRLSQADIGRFNDTPGSPDLIDEWSDPAQIAYTMDILGNMSLDRKNSGTSASRLSGSRPWASRYRSTAIADCAKSSVVRARHSAS